MRRMRSRIGESLACGGLLRNTSKNSAKNDAASMLAACAAGVPSGRFTGVGNGRPLPIGAEPTPDPVCG
ncbi:hypothetical protein G6F61_015260 [Rhizopus arrhizus]|nr:hypothetical protein G6F61_015260 [Rhizopus arrhizus]